MPNLKLSQICDPLYDYIDLDPNEKSLVDQELFQRLRYIQQLGFSEKAFPSGTGNRFCHSLGAFHLAGLAFDSVFNKADFPLKESKKKQFRKTLTIAALLHDIGHGPLSHSSEVLMPPLKSLNLKQYFPTEQNRSARHEDYNVKLLMEEKELYKKVQNSGADPSSVAQILHEDFSGSEDLFIEGGIDFLPLLKQIISSDFDVDRMDYLKRDSLLCGVKYGLIDFPWLISHFDSHIVNNKVFLAVAREGLYTLESFILGRQHMRMVVYFHHKSVIYNEMLKKYAENCHWKLPPDIENYKKYTDSRLFDHLKADSNNVWARRILSNKPYLRLYEELFFEESDTSEEDQKFAFLKSSLQKEGINFIDINSKKHSIKPSKNTLRKKPIYLKNKSLNQNQPLDQSSILLCFPSRKIQRIYVEPQHFSKAKTVLKQMK